MYGLSAVRRVGSLITFMGVDVRDKKSKVLWMFMTTVRELTEWRLWAQDSCDKFHSDLEESAKKVAAEGASAGISKAQLESNVRIRDSLKRISDEFRKIEKETRRFHGRTIRGDRAA